MSTTPTSPQWLTLFRRFTNAHFATCADEHKEGVSDAAVTRRYEASNAAEKAFLDAVLALEAECAELKAWKESALLVESRWDCQRVAKLLGITLGHDIRPSIEPKIRELLVDKARLLAIADEHVKAIEKCAKMFAQEVDDETTAQRTAIDSMRQAPVD